MGLHRTRSTLIRSLVGILRRCLVPLPSHEDTDMKTLLALLLIGLAGCATPINHASSITLEARQAAHQAALDQAAETLR